MYGIFLMSGCFVVGWWLWYDCDCLFFWWIEWLEKFFMMNFLFYILFEILIGLDYGFRLGFVVRIVMCCLLIGMLFVWLVIVLVFFFVGVFVYFLIGELCFGCWCVCWVSEIKEVFESWFCVIWEWLFVDWSDWGYLCWLFFNLVVIDMGILVFVEN